MPVFDNPNNPRQPKKGVYRWHFVCCHKKHTLYVGRAGGKASKSYKEPSTLYRGIAEASKNHTNPKNTNVIVGQCIDYVEKTVKNECHWEHISNNPNDESKFVRKYIPILQKGSSLKSKEIDVLKKAIKQRLKGRTGI